jgi:uncharacterized protein YndB with AHSA1/START domain
MEITRTFNAPRARVFDYWTSADRLQRWSGCAEATDCRVEMDFRIGGTFTQTMTIRGCGAFTIRGTYEEIVEPERIAYRVQLGNAMTRVVIEFFDLGAKTRVVLRQDGFPDDMTCTQVTRGTNESFDALATVVGR